MRRCLARVVATREVSQVIQRRPHCSATTAVVPEPQVGSNTRSPGSVVIKTQRAIALVTVCTTEIFGSLYPLEPVSAQIVVSGKAGKSSTKRTYLNFEVASKRRLFLAKLSSPA